MSAPPRLRGRSVAVTAGEPLDAQRLSFDTVLRAWWRGARLTRVVLRHRGERSVAFLQRVGGEGPFRDTPHIGVTT